jgi:UDP-N-acetylmuramoyl-tripeptide--D-alanyl-D-alanine ligase
MLELGQASRRLHQEVLEDAIAREIDLIVATGAFAEAAAKIRANAPSRLITATDWEEAYPLLRERLSGDEVVLLKASRGVALEGILPMIERDF